MGPDGKAVQVVPPVTPGMNPYQQKEVEQQQRRIAEEIRHNKAVEGATTTGDKSQPERDRQRALDLGAKVAAGKATPQEEAYYTRLYAETAQARVIKNPDGSETTIQPDVSDLPVPPSKRPPPDPNAPPPQPGAPPGLGTPPQPGASTVNVAPPPKAIEDARTAQQDYTQAMGAFDRVDQLSDRIKPGERLFGDKAAALEVEKQQALGMMAKIAGSGVLDKGERETYDRIVGELTGLTAAGLDAIGANTIKSRLNELRGIATRAYESKAVTVTSEAGYNAIPPGTHYRHPDGTIKVKQ